jgi:hypothetical protein
MPKVLAHIRDQHRLSRGRYGRPRMTADPNEVRIRVALDLGVSPEEILETIEIVRPQAGVVAFQHGFEVWAKVVGAKPLEPGISLHGTSEDTPT